MVMHIPIKFHEICFAPNTFCSSTGNSALIKSGSEGRIGIHQSLNFQLKAFSLNEAKLRKDHIRSD